MKCHILHRQPDEFLKAYIFHYTFSGPFLLQNPTPFCILVCFAAMTETFTLHIKIRWTFVPYGQKSFTLVVYQPDLVYKSNHFCRIVYWTTPLNIVVSVWRWRRLPYSKLTVIQHLHLVESKALPQLVVYHPGLFYRGGQFL